MTHPTFPGPREGYPVLTVADEEKKARWAALLADPPADLKLVYVYGFPAGVMPFPTSNRIFARDKIEVWGDGRVTLFYQGVVSLYADGEVVESKDWNAHVPQEAKRCFALLRDVGFPFLPTRMGVPTTVGSRAITVEKDPWTASAEGLWALEDRLEPMVALDALLSTLKKTLRGPDGEQTRPLLLAD